MRGFLTNYYKKIMPSLNVSPAIALGKGDFEK